MDTKGRFSSLRLFKSNGANGSGNNSLHSSRPQLQSPQSLSTSSPPYPPPKDRVGDSSAFFYTSSSIGAAKSTPDLSYNPMASPASFQSLVSPFLHQTSTSPTSSLISPATALRKSLSKLSSLGRRATTKSRNIPHSPSLNVLPECHDEGISTPYNFSHNIHVNDNLQGMPPSWFTTLLAAGYTEEEINRLRGRQRVPINSAATTPDPIAYGSTAATFSGASYMAKDLPSQFGELRRHSPSSNAPSQNTFLHHNPSTSISMFSSSVRSSSPSDERGSFSPSPHVAQQQLMRSPSYTQHFTGYTPSSHSHQTYSRSDTPRSHSPEETGSRSPTEALAYSHHSTATSINQPNRHTAVTPSINTHNFHPVMYRVVNEDPTPTTPPPAYASPKSPYRPSEKNQEKAFRWDVPSSSAQGEGPSSFEANPLSVISPPATEQDLTHNTPIQSISPSPRPMHVINWTSSNDISPVSLPEKGPPLLPSTSQDYPSPSAVETVIEEDHREVADADEGITPSLNSSPAHDSLKLDASTTAEAVTGRSSMESYLEPPQTLTEPPRLSFHTDQDDDWSTILTLSFSEGANNMGLKSSNSHLSPNVVPNPHKDFSLTASSSSFTPKFNRKSRRSSIIYGPRGSPNAKEKLYYNAEAMFSSTAGLEMVTLHEQQENSVPAAVHSAVLGETTENEEDWADNYLDMKDNDYDSSEGADILNENQEVSQEELILTESSSKLERVSSVMSPPPLTPAGLSPNRSSLISHSSIPGNAEQQDNNRNSIQIIEENGPLIGENPIHIIRSPRFSDNTVQPSSPRIIQYASASPSSSRRISAAPSSSAIPMSPSTPNFAPTLSPTSAMRPSSIISRRSFDLPPPLPPPEDELPPTPADVAAVGLTNPNTLKWVSQDMQSMRESVTDVGNEQDSQRSQSPALTSSSRQSSQRLLSSISTNIPTAPLSKRELPPVPPLKVNAGAKHTHIPMSSISSMASHGRSPSGHFPNSILPTVGRPPPLPLPPIGKVLPSVIMQQRRAAAEKNDPKGAVANGLSTVAANSNLTPSPSASTFSHSSRSAHSPETSETDSISENRKSSKARGDSYHIRVADFSSPAASQMVEEILLSRSEEVVDVDSSESSDYPMDTKVGQNGRIQENGWLPGTGDPEPDGHENIEQGDVLQSFSDLTAESPSPPVPLTPSIAVNGLKIPTSREPIPVHEQHSPKSFQMRSIPVELPLVLYPIKEFISIDVDPLDMFFDLQEIAQGQYGSVYMAQIQSEEDDNALAVAVKKVSIPLKGTPKIGQLKRELAIMSNIRHKHILETVALFYEPSESMLWIQMELMERSLADILALGDEGLEIPERVIARFASDILLALSYLNEQRLSHRDVRSDNLLMNSDGILKLADLSNAVQLPQNNSIRLDIVGIHHWQAPEIRSGRYDALKIDVWSLGATVWECAEFIPPFSDVEDLNALGVRWPPLSRGDEFSKEFHDFLRLCSEPAVLRPSASRLLRHPFVQTACPRVDVLSLLNLCRSIEEAMRAD